MKDFLNSEAVQGETRVLDFDLMTFRYHSIYETEDDNGNKLTSDDFEMLVIAEK